MGRTRAYKSLTHHLPAGSLLSLPVLVSVFGTIIIQGVFQVFIFMFVKQAPFYEPPVVNPEDANDSTDSYENTAVFFISIF